LQWVKWAVFAIRGAITAKWYLCRSEYPFRKNDILKIVEKYFPDHLTFVKEMYQWKVHEPTRKELCERFLTEQLTVLELFREKTQMVEAFVRAVNQLNLS